MSRPDRDRSQDSPVSIMDLWAVGPVDHGLVSGSAPVSDVNPMITAVNRR